MVPEVISSGAKALVYLLGDVAAEAATHKDYS